MPSRFSSGALVVVLTALLVPLFLGGAASAATPAEGAVGPASGSTAAWDYAAVGPGVSLGGTTETTGACAPVYCDAYALNAFAAPPAENENTIRSAGSCAAPGRDEASRAARPDKTARRECVCMASSVESDR